MEKQFKFEPKLRYATYALMGIGIIAIGIGFVLTLKGAG